MSIRYIDNITIIADVEEDVFLPQTLTARYEDGSFDEVEVTWNPSEVDTSVEGEFIFVGEVQGYVHDVLCSVQVGKIDTNPPSVFPKHIDQFGLPKKDIQTADIPDIDDYQYFKAKAPRTQTEEYQLKQLRELLYDKIILARDINHLRNATIEIEKFIQIMKNRMDDLQDRVKILEKETVIDGRNLGDGTEVFYDKEDRELLFRTIKGTGQAEVYGDGDEVIVNVDAPVGCGYDVQGDSFEVCGDLFKLYMGDGIMRFSEFFGVKMVQIKNHDGHDGELYYYSPLIILGMGSSIDTMVGAGRILKSDHSIIFEMKLGENQFIGLEIGKDGVGKYDQVTSRINEEIYDPDGYGLNVYDPKFASLFRPVDR